MPIISSFFDIYVRMCFADHAPPHIHVEYQGHEALVAIEKGVRDNLRRNLPFWFVDAEAVSVAVRSSSVQRSGILHFDSVAEAKIRSDSLNSVPAQRGRRESRAATMASCPSCF
ncbi:MAG: DUF4160 domain-containing protein [Rhodanobacteraceae bacterium]